MMKARYSITPHTSPLKFLFLIAYFGILIWSLWAQSICRIAFLAYFISILWGFLVIVFFTIKCSMKLITKGLAFLCIIPIGITVFYGIYGFKPILLDIKQGVVTTTLSDVWLDMTERRMSEGIDRNYYLKGYLPNGDYMQLPISYKMHLEYQVYSDIDLVDISVYLNTDIIKELEVVDFCV